MISEALIRVFSLTFPDSVLYTLHTIRAACFLQVYVGVKVSFKQKYGSANCVSYAAFIR